MSSPPIPGEYIALCDHAIGAAKLMQNRFRSAGNEAMAEWTETALALVREHRQDAVTGVLLRPAEGVGFELTRFAGETDWGAEGAEFRESLRSLQRYWNDHL